MKRQLHFTYLLCLCVFLFSKTYSQTHTLNNFKEISQNETQFLRDSDNPNSGKSWFRLSGSVGYSPILVGFVPGATDGYEDNFDGVFINEGCLVEFYSYCEAYKLEIQGRSELRTNQQIQIPLGYQVAQPGDYTISIVLEYIDSSFEILLEDLKENITIDLRDTDYTFNVSTPKEENNRFVLHYNYIDQPLNTDEFDNELSSINSCFLGEELLTKIINYSKLPNSVQIFEITGKEVLNDIYNDIISINSLSSGIYIVKYTFENSKTISKKVIKRY